MSSSDRRPVRKTVRSAAEVAAERDAAIEAETDDADMADAELSGADPVDGELNDDDLDTTPGGDADDARIEAYQSELVDRRKATIESARRRHGTAGAAIAAVGLQLQKMYEGKEDNEPAVIVQANSDPEDFEADGITVEVDGGSYHAPPLAPIDGQS